MRLDSENIRLSPLGVHGNSIPPSPVQVPSTTYPKTGQEPKGQADAKEESSSQEQKVDRKNSSLSNVTVSLGNRDESLVGLGNIGGIQTGVMRRAVSSMQKDAVLHEYQYFVGSGAVKNADNFNKGPGIITSDEDGVVIRK
ncbi:MAG: hypothetical protein K6G06_06390 [Butyrivibrio sp.]|nr:hypothetical protein [Butyrivibrio sp.]